MKQIDIDWLDASQFRILKEIIIFGMGRECEVELGRIFYKRQLTQSYCIVESEEEGGRDLGSIDKGIQGYPSQNDYPTDKSDEMIFSAVRDHFPNTVTRSDTYLHAADSERLETFKQRNIVTCPLYFTPGLWRLNEIYDRPEGTRNGLRAEINIYTLCDPRTFGSHVFIAKFDLRDRSWLSRLSNVEFE